MKVLFKLSEQIPMCLTAKKEKEKIKQQERHRQKENACKKKDTWQKKPASKWKGNPSNECCAP